MENRVKDGNYYVVQSFMLRDFRLKGLDLACYAIVYGFSQDGESNFTGSLQYLCDWTCSSKQAVIEALRRLVARGLLQRMDKVVKGVKFVEYRALRPTAGEETSLGSKETCIPPVKKVDYPSQESLPNNIRDNIPNNATEDKISVDKDKDINNKKQKGASAHDCDDSNESTDSVDPTALSMTLVSKGYISLGDSRMAEYNRMLADMESQFGIGALARALQYFLERFDGFDQTGKRIDDRLAYLTASLKDGCEKVRNIEVQIDGLRDHPVRQG